MYANTRNQLHQAHTDLVDRLQKGGYLDLDYSDLDSDLDEFALTEETKAERDVEHMNKINKERRLAEFWNDYVCDGYFMGRSENAIPEATQRSAMPTCFVGAAL